MNKLQEFWYCVANQEDLPLYKGSSIDSTVCDNLISCLHYYTKKKEEGQPVEQILSELLLSTPEMIHDIRLLLGVSDKRLYLDLTYINNRLHEERESLVKHDTKYFINKLRFDQNKECYAKMIAGYFVKKGIEVMLDTFASLDFTVIAQLFNNLIAPKEIQQKQAKYRGHGAEMTFASVFHDCGLDILPEDKYIDPMGSNDPNVDLKTMQVVSRDVRNPYNHSFDLIILDEKKRIKILVQSLIHSSDPGQFGVNKSDETLLIKQQIEEYNKEHEDHTVYLLGSVDGVGFSENPNGTIVKMLEAFDDFFQMHTLFKIPLFLQKIHMIDSVSGIVFDDDYFEPYAQNHFYQTYVKLLDIDVLPSIGSCKSGCLKQYGKGTILYKTNDRS